MPVCKIAVIPAAETGFDVADTERLDQLQLLGGFYALYDDLQIERTRESDCRRYDRNVFRSINRLEHELLCDLDAINQETPEIIQ